MIFAGNYVARYIFDLFAMFDNYFVSYHFHRCQIWEALLDQDFQFNQNPFVIAKSNQASFIVVKVKH